MAYRLEKYTNRSSRHTCPYCGKPFQFSYYVDESGKPLNEYVGRCNRETNCGVHYKPADFFRDHPDLKVPDNFAKPAPIKERKLYFLDLELVALYLRGRSVLTRWLCSIFPADMVEYVCTMYRIGNTADGRTIFWQIDYNGKVRSGKVMEYGEDGHRVKREQDRINWMHAYLKRDGKLTPEWELTQCFFGEELLRVYPDKTVCIVESEKTAIIAAIVWPSMLWIATGGKNNLNGEKLAPLKGRKIIVWPDADAVDKWAEKVRNAQKFYNIELASVEYTEEEKDKHFDIADKIIQEYGKNFLRYGKH